MIFYYAVINDKGKFVGFIKSNSRKECMDKSNELNVKLFGVPIIHDMSNKKSNNMGEKRK